MRIAINCRSILLTQRTGIGRYTYHLLESLGHIDQANEYILHAPKGLFSFQKRLPDFSDYKNLKRYPDYFKRGVSDYDIYHFPCPDEIGTYTGKLIVTIHDLIYKAYPQGHTQETIELTDKFMRQITAKADKIICVSENTRRDLHACFDVAPGRSCVVHHGVDHELFYPLLSQERQEAAHQLKLLGIAKPYVLFVGTIEPRKNLTGLLEAFALLKSKRVFDGQLVVAGMQGWMSENVQSIIERLGIKSDVIFTGFISDKQLRQLYNMAEVFMFPSFYEGFGFPILEAFSCGTAVITSNAASCLEIASDAALIVDPWDERDMALSLERLLTDKKLKSTLQEAGIKRAQDFSFDKMAQNTLDVYQKVSRAK
jgi:glycosyltransferase involved in cell wall biosynthesis